MLKRQYTPHVSKLPTSDKQVVSDYLNDYNMYQTYEVNIDNSKKTTSFIFESYKKAIFRDDLLQNYEMLVGKILIVKTILDSLTSLLCFN